MLKNDTGFQSDVGSTLKSDKDFKDSVKGDPGEKGLPGNDGQPGAQGPKGKDANPLEIVSRIKHDSRFKREVRGEKGDTGEQGLEGRPGNDGQPGAQGQSGKDGESPPAKDVAAQLLTDGNKDTLATEIAGNEGLQKAVADNQNLKTAVTTDLKGDGDFQVIIKGERGERGPQGDPGNDVPIKHRFTLQKGEKLSEDIYEANIVLNGKTMAVLPKIGYYMLGDRLVMCNHVTKEEVAIPRDFHYLKVVKLGSGFDSDDYKLTFCNVLGNQFFEYKKYDPQYSNISDEYKFISLSCAKKEYDLNLSELLSYQPLFFITEGSAELGSIDIYFSQRYIPAR